LTVCKADIAHVPACGRAGIRVFNKHSSGKWPYCEQLLPTVEKPLSAEARAQQSNCLYSTLIWSGLNYCISPLFDLVSEVSTAFHYFNSYNQKPAHLL